MPIHPSMKLLYPDDWPVISRRIRFEWAEGYCERCGAMDAWFHPETGAVVQLQAAHLDHDPGNNEDGNLTADRSAINPAGDFAAQGGHRGLEVNWSYGYGRPVGRGGIGSFRRYTF